MDGPIQKDSLGTVLGSPRNTKKKSQMRRCESAHAFGELYISAINERSLDRLQQDQPLQHRLARSNSFVLPYSQQKYHGKTERKYYFVAYAKSEQNSLGSSMLDNVISVEFGPGFPSR